MVEVPSVAKMISYPTSAPWRAVCSTEKFVHAPGLLAFFESTEIFTKERQNVILKPVRNSTGMGAVIDFKNVRNTVIIENIVQLAGIDSEPVLVSYVNRDTVVLSQIADVLIHEGEWRIGSPFCEHVRLGLTVFRRQVEI